MAESLSEVVKRMDAKVDRVDKRLDKVVESLSEVVKRMDACQLKY